MKEQTLKTIDANTLPANLRYLSALFPEATWNGYNVWTSSDDPERMKSLGFTLAKNGKHEGQWFTSEKAQESLAKRLAKKRAQTAKPKAQTPEAAESPAIEQPAAVAPGISMGEEFCCIVEADMKLKGEVTHVINLTRVKNCSPEQFKEHCESLKSISNVNIKVVKNYSSDGIFINAFRHMKEYQGRDFYHHVVKFDMDAYLRSKKIQESLSKQAA